jgi:hypothetical protein
VTIDPANDAAELGRYQPGACNIGPAEIARRRRAGWVGLGVALAWAVGALFLGGGPLVRFGVVLPLAGAFVGFLQARRRFCAAYGFLGLRNFGPLGRAEVVEDPEARRRDRAAALRLVGEALLLAAVPGLVFALLPLPTA